MSDVITRVDAVIQRILDGENLVSALKSLPLDPGLFYKTIQSNPKLAESYAQAEQFRAEMLAQEIVEIADTDSDPQRARNRIQVRQWMASKVIPRKYGDNIQVSIDQRIDIQGALSEARQRALQPVCNPAQVIDAQVVDYIDVQDTQPTDTQSVATPTPADNDDIFK